MEHEKDKTMGLVFLACAAFALGVVAVCVIGNPKNEREPSDEMMDVMTLDTLKKKMKDATLSENYELAAKFRDQINLRENKQNTL